MGPWPPPLETREALLRRWSSGFLAQGGKGSFASMTTKAINDKTRPLKPKIHWRAIDARFAP
jgi:hypothetical protein